MHLFLSLRRWCLSSTTKWSSASPQSLFCACSWPTPRKTPSSTKFLSQLYVNAYSTHTSSSHLFLHPSSLLLSYLFLQEGMPVTGTAIFDDSLDVERLAWIQDHVLAEINGICLFNLACVSSALVPPNYHFYSLVSCQRPSGGSAGAGRGHHAAAADRAEALKSTASTTASWGWNDGPAAASGRQWRRRWKRGTNRNSFIFFSCRCRKGNGGCRDGSECGQDCRCCCWW